MKIKMKPETIERRRLERIANDAHSRELFERTYATAKTMYADLPAMPKSGCHLMHDHADGSSTVIATDRFIHF